jgi:ATP-dependent DNA ligase
MIDIEGIVSKRKGSAYRSGRTLDWIKSKKPSVGGRQARG